ncbi:hypothetical protein, partial [Chengkuizengella marina]|uniref:hypothetical protein n=1 Tax=Chengkuizengella marina TaxID=2507566 RepID=UPI00191BFD5E
NLPTLSITSHNNDEIVSNNSLELTWNYSDLDDQEQSAYQVIGSQDNWESWSYNSEEVVSSSKTHTTPQLAGGDWDFAIKVWDGVEWSEEVYLNNIQLPISYEPNDDFNTAYQIVYDNNYSSIINSINDVDFFKIVPNQSGIHYLSLQVPVGVDYDFYIYNMNMDLVTEATLSNDEYFLAESDQNYYIKIFSSDGSFSEEPYSFIVNPLELNIETQYQYDENGNLINKQKMIKN